MCYSFAVGKVDSLGGTTVNVQTDALGASEGTQQRRLLELLLAEIQVMNANFAAANPGLQLVSTKDLAEVTQ